MRPLLGVALFLALVGVAALGIIVITGWLGWALALGALLVIATLPVGAR